MAIPNETPSSDRLNVLLEVGPLGLRHANPERKGIAGVYRVVERLASGLPSRPGLQVSYCAAHNHAHTRAYHQENLRALGPTGTGYVPERVPAWAWPLQGATRLTERLCAGYYGKRGRHFPVVGRPLWKISRELLREVDPASVRRAQVWHSASSPVPDWVRRHPHLQPFVTIHDLTVMVVPELFPPGAVARLQRGLSMVRPTDWVFCVSQSTKRDLLRLVPNCDPGRVLVTPLAADAKFRPVDDKAAIARVKTRYGVPSGVPYFLSVCTLEPRKNLDLVIDAFVQAARERLIDDEVRLVLVGDHGWMQQKIFAAYERSGECKKRIVLTGFVADEDLATLYSGALGFVYMSLYEGFGLPPLEAMQCGVPVVTSNVSSLPEVVGDAGVQLDPRDGASLTETFGRLATDSALRQAMAQRSLVQARRFSWERFLAQVERGYRLAVEGGSAAEDSSVALRLPPAQSEKIWSLDGEGRGVAPVPGAVAEARGQQTDPPTLLTS